ncbi:MAG: hypothetical protein K2J80_05945 [Oscillospiraceae bacterium]|nr:hypothetical protein [Oscillospiraceae bacterium]
MINTRVDPTCTTPVDVTEFAADAIAKYISAMMLIPRPMIEMSIRTMALHQALRIILRQAKSRLPITAAAPQPVL